MPSAESLPKNFSIEPTADGAVILRRWHSDDAWWDAVYALIAVAFVVVCVLATVDEGLNAVLVIFSLPAFAWIYRTAALFVNRTRIEVSASRVSVRHGPLPWAGTAWLERTQVREVFAEVLFGGKHGKTRTYRVAAMLESLHKVPVVERTDEPRGRACAGSAAARGARRGGF